ncbi:hypothetical protein GCM10027190_62820 [Spirosoma areae]
MYNGGYSIHETVGHHEPGGEKDFYDIYELINRYGFAQLCDWYQQKFPNTSLFMMLKSVTCFDDADQSETPVLLERAVSWNDVKASILKNVTAYS